MKSEPFTAQSYRQEALRVRRAAMVMRDRWVRQGMFSIAAQYDGLAQFVETCRFPQVHAAG